MRKQNHQVWKKNHQVRKQNHQMRKKNHQVRKQNHQVQKQKVHRQFKVPKNYHLIDIWNQIPQARTLEKEIFHKNKKHLRLTFRLKRFPGD